MRPQVRPRSPTPPGGESGDTSPSKTQRVLAALTIAEATEQCEEISSQEEEVHYVPDEAPGHILKPVGWHATRLKHVAMVTDPKIVARMLDVVRQQGRLAVTIVKRVPRTKAERKTLNGRWVDMTEDEDVTSWCQDWWDEPSTDTQEAARSRRARSPSQATRCCRRRRGRGQRVYGNEDPDAAPLSQHESSAFHQPPVLQPVWMEPPPEAGEPEDVVWEALCVANPKEAPQAWEAHNVRVLTEQLGLHQGQYDDYVFGLRVLVSGPRDEVEKMILDMSIPGDDDRGENSADRRSRNNNRLLWFHNMVLVWKDRDPERMKHIEQQTTQVWVATSRRPVNRVHTEDSDAASSGLREGRPPSPEETSAPEAEEPGGDQRARERRGWQRPRAADRTQGLRPAGAGQRRHRPRPAGRASSSATKSLFSRHGRGGERHTQIEEGGCAWGGSPAQPRRLGPTGARSSLPAVASCGQSHLAPEGVLAVTVEDERCWQRVAAPQPFVAKKETLYHYIINHYHH